MEKRAPGHMRLTKRRALHAVSSAFKWLADNKSCDYRVEWLDDYPLLVTSSRRDAFLNYQLLRTHSSEGDERSAIVGPFNCLQLTPKEELIERFVDKGRHIAFTYLDTPFRSHDLRRQVLLRQQKTIRDLFTKSHNSENILTVRGDTLQSNGSNSIRECITSLVCAKFFMSSGYAVVEDCGSGPDLIAFKTNLLGELRARRFIGRGASMSQLATMRVLGKTAETCKEDAPQEEIIAVESESNNPQSGIKQLRGDYSSQRFSYMGFFDRRVLAAPFFNQQLRRVDVLTYDVNGLRYRKCNEARSASDFWKHKKLAFLEELHNLMKGMLLCNLSLDEIRSMISAKPLTPYQVLKEAPKLEMGKILDKIEGSM